MLRRPDVDEVMEYGRALGFDLTATEARMIQARMMDTVAALEAFDEMRVEERRPPLRFTDRDAGGRPRVSARCAGGGGAPAAAVHRSRSGRPAVGAGGSAGCLHHEVPREGCRLG